MTTQRKFMNYNSLQLRKFTPKASKPFSTSQYHTSVEYNSIMKFLKASVSSQVYRITCYIAAILNEPPDRLHMNKRYSILHLDV